MSSTVTLTQTRPSRSGAVAPAPAPSPSVGTVAGKVATVVLIDDAWFDLTSWKHHHPGGAHILEQISGQDATDAFYSLHSEEAIARLRRLPHSKALPAALAGKAAPAPPSAQTVAFRHFRAQLAKEGFFKRSVGWEAFYTLSVYVLMALGSYLAYSGHPLLAILFLALGAQQAGWIGHDYTHGRGAWSNFQSHTMPGLVNGFSRAWWSNKHNTHHVFTNYIGVDADIENDPVFHLFFPDPKDDTFFRKMQHWYFVPVASLLYISWCSQSLLYALRHRKYGELAAMVVHYAWMYTLGFWVALAHVYLAGGLVAIIVTVTHQSEEMLEVVDPATGQARNYAFCEGQFATTRDARTNNFFMEWLWGGMQYQLEHHLFPTMPKYYYAQVRPRVEQFAKAHGLEYKIEGQLDILKRNFNTLKYFAQDRPPATPQAKKKE